LKISRNIYKNLIILSIITSLIYSSHVMSGVVKTYGINFNPLLKGMILLFSISLSIYYLKDNIKKLKPGLLSLLVILSIGGTSLVYSLNINASVEGVIFLICDFLLCLIMVGSFGKNEILRTIKISFNIIFFIMIFYTLLNYQSAFSRLYDGSYIGSFPHKNISGSFITMYSLLMATLINKKSDFLNICLFFIGVLLLTLTKSSTSYVALFISILFLIVMKKRKMNLNSIKFLGLFNIVFYHIFLNSKIASVFFQKVLKRDITLTGRTDIWKALLEILDGEKLFGYGFNALWDNKWFVKLAWGKTGFKYIGSHNGFIELLLQVGIVGFIVVIIGWLVIPMLKIKYLRHDNMTIFLLVFYSYFLIFSITERTFIGSDYLNFLLILSSIYIEKNYFFLKKYKRKKVW